MNGGIKENANPTIIHVEKDSSRLGNSSRLWSSINALACGDCEMDEQTCTDSNTLNQSILIALQDVSAATDRGGVSLLINSGLMLHPLPDKVGRKVNICIPLPFSVFIPKSNETTTLRVRNEQLQRERIGEHEVFHILRNIQDPEHPLTLEQLGVVSRQQVEVNDFYGDEGLSKVDVRFTPTIPHCSMATLIGLCIRVKLLRSLPNNDRFKVTVRIEPGTHNSESAVNKQLADKERVCAALENKHLLSLVDKCIASGMRLRNLGD
jgi:metal-sulfur cluster biosynthetic enzyme